MKRKEPFFILLSFSAVELSHTFSAVDVDMHCQKVENCFLAVHVLFGGACCFSVVDLELFGGGCGFSVVDVLFSGGLKNPLPRSGVGELWGRQSDVRWTSQLF